ncbi:CCA tRNA nucleotidyltransferase [Sphingobium subterraneum]|uniref:Poly(A) polymerase n=1 Tax=Sphingobium subterraneum TaxID=627688 RepID=A0A841J3X3_9SPHN|nr:CCA tRNA nucleotidyltransferase [Sphingobium subterraneum]MBB6123218.1 poly(A) polymerase [Sphingobium subterraneum]
MTTFLPDAPWRHRPGLDELFAVLEAETDTVRYVGGAVRDGLLGDPVSDIDLATTYPPDETMARLHGAGIKVVPTGIAHGTVTAIIDHRPVEITTLRHDVETDGRRATVAYTDDWQADAARRDFTINALYASPIDGRISDYFSGLDDLAAGRVRFIGDPGARISEDHLRILRFFRFFARFGQGAPDAAAYEACRAHANSLMALSRERIADELLKLLALPHPVPAVRLMVEGDILAPVLPEITSEGLAHLATLVDREAAAGVQPCAVLRLAALLPRDGRIGEQAAARLKLSNKARKRIATALSGPPAHGSARELAFRVGQESAIDMILLDPAKDPRDVSVLRAWHVPALPVGGADLLALGMAPGPDIARTLTQIREQWIAEGFPSAERARAIAAQIASNSHRESQ